jgi:hypothetical protein
MERENLVQGPEFLAMTDQDVRFPIQLAIRLFLDSVSYSNALPEWFELLTIDYDAREATIRDMIGNYSGGAEPPKPLQIAVPKRNGVSHTWVVPSINDQIVCQACTSLIATQVQSRCIDPAKVFSCRLNFDEDRLAFLEDQVSAWASFQARAQQFCADGKTCVLQIDLKDAFDSIPHDKIIDFIGKLGVNVAAVRVLEGMLRAFVTTDTGIPFMNDSLFFLGNAYISKADAVVAKRSPNFIRFADDYKIFGTSTTSLEEQFGAIQNDLKAIGWEINDNKVWLGTSEDYLQAVSKMKYGATAGTDYVNSAVQPGVYNASSILGTIKTCLAKPDDYLHQGFGRLEMGAIRRMRATGIFSDAQQYAASPDAQFGELLGEDSPTITTICNLLDQYSQTHTNSWRLVWLLYLCKDLGTTHVSDKTLQKKLADISSRIQADSALPPVCRIWAKSMPRYPNIDKTPAQIEELHKLGYIERGQACYGA